MSFAKKLQSNEILAVNFLLLVNLDFLFWFISIL